MPTRAPIIFGFVLAVALAGPARAQRPESAVHAAATLMSDYKHLGLSHSDSRPAVKLAVDYDHRSGFFAGGYLVNVEYAAEYGSATPRDYEVDAYVGYQWRGARWTANAIVSRYIYPGIDFRYDYTRSAVNLAFKDRYFFGAAYSENFYSINRSAYDYFAGAAIPLRHGLEIGINIGRFQSSELRNASYTFWDVGVSRLFPRFVLDLRYHDNTYDRTTRLGDGRGDHWVFSASYAIATRRSN
jgi:uncharacterized protein (TIGR02001 family)